MCHQSFVRVVDTSGPNRRLIYRDRDVATRRPSDERKKRLDGRLQDTFGLLVPSDLA
jgi:hypothetical protein